MLLQVIPADGDSSIEALLWHNNILYKAGLDGELVEYNMDLLQPAVSCLLFA